MELKVKHLSGSRSGQVQSITTQSATIGRNPSNHVAFDPETDRAVSGLHAELQYRDGAWWLRDLGSSNGTWINGERVSEKMIRPGEVVQLGQNGPRIQLEYDASSAAMGAAPPPAPPGAVEGRTVMMMVQGAPAAAAGGAAAGAATAAPIAAPPIAVAPRSKGRSLGKVLLVVFLLFGILIAAGIAGAVMIRRRNLARKPQGMTAAQVKAAEAAAKIRTQIEQTKATMAQAQQTLQQTQQSAATTTDTTGAAQKAAEAQDLQRQLEEQQRMIDELTRQLQDKNEQIRPRTAAQQPPVSNNRDVSPAESEMRRRADAERARRLVMERAAQQQAAQQAAQQRAQATPTPQQQAQVTSTPTVQPTPQQQQQQQAAQLRLTTSKSLKKRIRVQAVPSDIPIPDLPNSASRDLARLIVGALASSGAYVNEDRGSIASVAVMVTNFSNESSTTVDTEAAGRTVGALGGLVGKNVPRSPVNVASGSRSAEMSIVVRVSDSTGRQLTETNAAAAASDRKSSATADSLSFGQTTIAGDSPLSDVTRKVVADALDGIRGELDRLEWRATLQDQKKDGVMVIDCGNNCAVEVGDVFDVIDGGAAVARFRITQVDARTSTGQLLSGNPAAKLKGKPVRYAGREDESSLATAQGARYLQVRSKTKVYDGPGRTFRAGRELNTGARVRYLYSIGTWAKATDGSGVFWIPMSAAQVVR
jgi:hypothetical protein